MSKSKLRTLDKGEVFFNKYREDRPGNNLVVIKDRCNGIVDVWFESPSLGMTVENGLAVKGSIPRSKLAPDFCDCSPATVHNFKTPFDQRLIKGAHCDAYVGGFKYTRARNKKAYTRWKNMLERVFTCLSPILELQRLQRTYSKEMLLKMGYLKGDTVGFKWDWAKLYEEAGQCRSYADVVVSLEFLNFQKFATWYYRQPGCMEKGWHLDKDLLSMPGKRIYSPDTCCFLPSEINNALRAKAPLAKKLHALAEKHKTELDPRAYEALLAFKEA